MLVCHVVFQGGLQNYYGELHMSRNTTFNATYASTDLNVKNIVGLLSRIPCLTNQLFIDLLGYFV